MCVLMLGLKGLTLCFSSTVGTGTRLTVKYLLIAVYNVGLYSRDETTTHPCMRGEEALSVYRTN